MNPDTTHESAKMTINKLLDLTDEEYECWVALSTQRDQAREDVLRGVLDAWERELER